MKIDKFNLTAYFIRYNNEYFNGILPVPQFKVRHSYFTLGYFSCRYDNDYEMYDTLLEISDRYDYTDEQLRDIIVHEMIHYYLAYTKEDVRMKHGRSFMDIAKILNSEYNMNISPKINVSKYRKKFSFSLSYILVHFL